jgi:hypothetical protein
MHQWVYLGTRREYTLPYGTHPQHMLSQGQIRSRFVVKQHRLLGGSLHVFEIYCQTTRWCYCLHH